MCGKHLLHLKALLTRVSGWMYQAVTNESNFFSENSRLFVLVVLILQAPPPPPSVLLRAQFGAQLSLSVWDGSSLKPFTLCGPPAVWSLSRKTG